MRSFAKIVSGATALLFAAVAASASLAQQVRPVEGAPPKPVIPHSMPTFAPLATPAPAATGAPSHSSNLPFPGMRVPSADGQRVPLSSLPPLPPKTQLNTAYFQRGTSGRRPMSATGATINYAPDFTNNTSCLLAVGTLIPSGCDVIWNAASLVGGDTWQDYFIDLNTSTGVTSGGTYTGANGANRTTPNLSTGTYVLATKDTTLNKWATVVYVSVGSVNVFGTYADSGATIPQTQFVAANGTNVYINATGLTQGQSYVAYIESTSVNPACTYIAPPGSVVANTLCDPTTSSGITAVVGAQSSAAITAVWPLSAATPTGTYAVVLYNLTTHTRLAMRQVSITKTGSTGAFSVIPFNGNGALPANWPTPPPGPYSATTKFAFDNTTEQSDKGFAATATGLTLSTNYSFTLTDPTGAVVFGPQANNSGGTGSITKNVNFAAANSPSNYVGNVYTLQMYNQTTKAVDASQAIQILGYNAVTQFQDPTTSAISTAVVLPQGSSVTESLQFVNDGDSLYGTGNGDTLSGIAFNTGNNGIWINLTDPSVTTGCGGGCQQQIVTDTNGQSWTVQNTCYGGNGANKGCTLTAYPSGSNSLAMSATLSIPNVQFNNVPGNSNCQAGCSGLTSILPTDGVTWSQTNNSSSTNAVAFTNASGKTWAGTAGLSHIGYRDLSNVLHNNQDAHGYTPNESNAIYTQTSPFTANISADVWGITITNNASVGTANLSQFEVTLPTAYAPSGAGTVYFTDSTSPTQWNVVNCPVSTASSAFCLKSSGGNTGIPPGSSQTVYVDVAPGPPGSFSYTDWSFQAITPTQFTMTPAASFTGFVPQNVFDSTASAAYSLNGNLITPGFAPTSEGQNTNNALTINVSNASTAQDPNPDYLDLITIDLPTANALTNLSGMPTGWSLLGTTTPVAGTTRYWFGLCASQFVAADGPVANPPPVNPTVPSCGAATEANAMAPGQIFTVTGNLQTATANITATMYAHGANVAGWSAAHTFTLNVTAVSAAAGFSAAGGYPTANAVTSPQTPQIGADSDSTFGNAYTYVIKNTSATGNNITSAVITIPGKDTSAVLPPDGTAWTLTGTPTISGTTYNCSITSSSSATTAGANGAINIGGGSCSIPPGSTITIKFTAKAPYTVNDTYQFPTKVNGAVNASEQWSTDTIVQIILAANLVISVNPGADASTGSTPVVNCPSCTFNTGTNTVDFGSVLNLQTVSGVDVVRVSVFTNAGSTIGWKLYASTNSNPANTGTPTNELLTAIDSGANRSMPQAGINFDQTSYAVVPTSNPGVLLMDTGTGHAATRNPFDMLMNYQISIQGGPVTPNTSVVTYTFISN